MDRQRRSKIQWNQKCSICDMNFSVKDAYILHLLGKRHQKNVKKRDKSQVNVVRKRTVCFSGNRNRVPLQTIVGYFLDRGISNVSSVGTTIFIEFETEEAAEIVLQRKNYNIRALHLRASPMKQPPEREDKKVRISHSLQRRMSQTVTGHQLHKHIEYLIKEIEMKPWELKDRESLLRGIVNYLSPCFPKVFGHIFGSSANNLGFTGCDVDIYLDIGVYPWIDCETKAAAQAQGRDITWFLSRKIRESGRAIKVEAIPRARVPIVKFQDRSSKIMVDLSFRNGMPVYNTRLISQYTHTHPLVRPYLMVIRYWAKIQDVAGGGKPSHLITNYALTLIMLFYLMYRDDPIIPSLLSLRRRGTYTPVFIGPWDVSFSSDVSEWRHKIHHVSVMELVSEFFTFYSELKASEWVISPLAGLLFSREDFQVRSVNLPECFRTYMEQEDDLQLANELCVQDPFEHSHNCTRGLEKMPFLEFQYKCRMAAEITGNVLMGEQTLSDLFQEYQITPDMIKDIAEESSQVDSSEVISIDDSDTSQEIEVLDTLNETDAQDETECYSVETSDIEIISADTYDIEILFEDQKANVSSAEETASVSNDHEVNCAEDSFKDESECQESTSAEVPENCNSDEVKSDLACSEANGDDQTVKPSSSTDPRSPAEASEHCNSDAKSDLEPSEANSDDQTVRPSYPLVVNTLPRISSFQLNYSRVPGFRFTPDGVVSRNVGARDTGESASLLIEFILRECLKVEMTTVDNSLTNERRKALVKVDKTKAKPDVSPPGNYLRVSKYECEAKLGLWNGRKKITRSLTRHHMLNPLQYELVITRNQIEKHSYTTNNTLRFTIEVWQELSNPEVVHVTGNSLSDLKVTQGQMIPMFHYFSSLCLKLLKKLTNYIQTSLPRP